MKPSKATTFEEWYWKGGEEEEVMGEKTGALLTQSFEDDHWALKEYLHDHDLRMKDVYFEAAARMVWRIQKEHRKSDMVVPWLAPPYGTSETIKLKKIVLNLAKSLVVAAENSAHKQGATGYTIPFTIRQVELIRRGIIEPYQAVELGEPIDDFSTWGLPEENRIRVGWRIQPGQWKKLQRQAITYRKTSNEYIDGLFLRFVKWHDQRDESKRVPFLAPCGDTKQLTAYVHPSVVKELDRVAVQHSTTRAALMTTANLYELARLGTFTFDTAMLTRSG